jgi:hypothetical protein
LFHLLEKLTGSWLSDKRITAETINDLIEFQNKMYELQFYFVRTREAALKKKISDSSFSFSFRLSSEKKLKRALAPMYGIIVKRGKAKKET